MTGRERQAVAVYIDALRKAGCELEAEHVAYRLSDRMVAEYEAWKARREWPTELGALDVHGGDEL